MHIIIGVIFLILISRYVIRPVGGKLITTLRNTRWLKLRKKDALYSLGAITLIVAIEYSVPSLALTGLKQHKAPEPEFLTEKVSWVDTPITYENVGKLSKWLGGFRSISKDEYKLHLRHKIDLITKKIVKLNENIKEQKLELESDKNSDRAHLIRRQISEKERLLNRTNARYETLNFEKKNLDNRFADIDTFFGDSNLQQNYKLLALELEDSIKSKKALLSLREKRHDVALSKLKAYLKEHENTENKGKHTSEYKNLYSVKSTIDTSTYRTRGEIYQLERSEKQARNISNRMVPTTVFPMLDAPIEVLSETIRANIEQTIMGPSAGFNATKVIKNIHRALVNDPRIKHPPKDEIRCYIYITSKEGNPNAQQSCEVLLVVPINYDLTFPYCEKPYLDYDKPNKINGTGLTQNACIERWKFPHLRIIVTEDTLTIHEPTVNNLSNSEAKKYGTSIGRWEVIYDTQNLQIDGEITIPWNGDLSKLSKIKLRHLPNEALLDNVLSIPVNSVMTKQSPIHPSVRIWQDFDTDRGSEAISSLVLFNKYHETHAFIKNDINITLPPLFFSNLKRHLNNSKLLEERAPKPPSSEIQSISNLYNVSTNKDTRHLENRLYDFNRVASREYNTNKQSGVFLTAKICKFPFFIRRDASSISYEKTKSEMKNLLFLIRKENGDIDCRKYDAIRAMFESLISFKKGELF